jgi:predicted ATPase/DNA-binding winged helix-turn-helix (wHTH) protein
MSGRPDFQAKGALSFGPFSLSLAERLLKRDDDPVPLGGRALDVLIALTERAGEVVSYRELISIAWPNVTVDEANLRVQIAALRKALNDGEHGVRYISNVAGRGYCFVAPVAQSTGRPIAAEGNANSERPRKLPPRLARMVGRDEAVRSVSEQLIMGRFVSIVGPGGIGKTTVAVSVAHALLNGFSGAVSFIDLGALTNPQLVPAAVASALGFMIQAHDPFGSLVAFLGQKKILLILDNCEHVIDSAAVLAERVVSAAPQAHILTTSREALRAEGERVHLLYSLDCPPEHADLTAAEVLTYPAAQLFMERAAAGGYSSALSDIDAPIVAAICRRLDGIALAIELAASRVGSLGVRGTAELLDNRFGLLWHGRRTALPRHHTLNSMLDWSYSLLSEHEKVVLCRLSVFVGDFTLQAIRSVASGGESDEADVVASVVSLAAKSLVSTSVISGSIYYRLLDTTRAYAATKLASRGDADRISRQHAIFFAKFLQGDEIVQSRFGEHDLSGYAPHIGNVRAALEWALSDHGNLGIGVELSAWAAPLFIGLSLLDECRSCCERALTVIDDASRDTRLEMILQEALALSSMYTRGHSDQIRAAIERALVLAETLGDQLHQLQLLAGLNLFLNRLGDLRGSLAAAERGNAIALATADPAGLIWAEWILGISHYLEGKQAAAQFHCERGLALAAERSGFNGNYFGCDHRIRALVALARVLWLRGFSDRALKTAQKVIDEASSQDQPISICISLMYCSSVFLWTGDLPSAADFIEKLIAYSGRYSLEPYSAAGVALKGELAVTRDEAEAGVGLLRKALEIMHTEQYQVVVTTFIGALAEGLRKSGKLQEALFTINGAIAQATSSGAKFELPELLRIKAQILAAQNDRESAIACLTEALTVARKQSALALELRSAMALARLLPEGEQRDQARRELALVYDRFTEGFQTEDLRQARALLEDLQSRS